MWREDRTNRDNYFTRNFIRNKLIPDMENNINERVIDHLAAFADEMRYYREEEERQGESLIEVAAVDKKACFDGGMDLDRAIISALPVRERIILIREAVRRLKIQVLPRERCMELARLMEGKKKFEFQCEKGARILGERDRVKWIGTGSVC
jgi:tRNA(Ile)-lysidine synthase TilS/MesJ